MSIRKLVWPGLLLTLVWAALLISNFVPQIRGDYGWRWPYELPTAPERILPLLTGIMLYIVGARYLFRKKGYWLVLWSVAGCVGLTLAGIFVDTPRVGYELYVRTISPITTGWHFAGAEMDDRGPDYMLETWDERMEEYHLYSAHLALSPPGLPLGFYGASEALEGTSLADRLGQPLRAEQCHDYRFQRYDNAEFASAWLGILTPVWAALTAIPLYWLGKHYYSETAARWSIIWWGFLPGVLIFTPYPSVIYPLLGLVMILALLHSLLENRPLWVILAGLVMSLTSFLNLSTLPLIFLAGLLALAIHYRERATRPVWWSAMMGLWFVMGLISVWGLFYLRYGVGPWDMLETSMNVHLELDRPYLPWLFLHFYDFVIFAGLPVFWLGLFALWRLRSHFPLMVGFVLSAAVLITLVVLDLSGVGRGETGRVWLFLAPYFLLIGGYWLDKTEDLRFGWIITSVQAIAMLAILLVLRPIGTDTSPPPSPPTLPVEPETTFLSSNALFDNAIILDSFSGFVNSDGDLEIWLRWRSQGQVDVPYYLSLLPVAPDGTAQTALVRQPFNETYPMTCWLPDVGTLADYYIVPLDQPQAGDWWISLSIIDRNGNQLQVVMPDGTTDTQAGIGPFASEAAQ